MGKKDTIKATVIIPMRTFRIHDNPLLAHVRAADAHVLLVVDARRIPRRDPYSARVDDRMLWSIPQAWFYLQCVLRHHADLVALGIAASIAVVRNRREMRGLLSEWSARHDHAVCDIPHDPAYDDMCDHIAEAFPRVTRLETCTLVDWGDVRHAVIVNGAFSTPYKKTEKLKAHIRNHAAAPLPAIKKTPTNTGTHDRDADVRRIIDGELRDLKRLAERSGVEVYPFVSMFDCGSNRSSFDKQVRSFASRNAKRIGTRGWQKPDTARNLSLLEHARDPKLDTSKLSPYLAAGILSVRTFYRWVRQTTWKMGTAEDQLLFRECWYVAAIADEKDHLAFWNDTPKWWVHRNKKAKYSAKVHGRAIWTKQPSHVRMWIRGTMDESWEDANESMKLLHRTGWLHHLRRHLVADVLCYRLNGHFLHGEAWFRRTLIDHDAVLNRANWLWLSASAFSTKQAMYHYSPANFISRNSTRALLPSWRACKRRFKG